MAGHWLLMVCLINVRFLFAAILTLVFILNSEHCCCEHCAYVLVMFLSKYQE